MKNTLSRIEDVGNKLVGELVGTIASSLGCKPSDIFKAVGDQEILDLLEKHDKAIRHQILALLEEIKAELKTKRFRKVMGGYRQKGELGTATSMVYCEAYNSALSDVKEKLNKMIKNLGEEI